MEKRNKKTNVKEEVEQNERMPIRKTLTGRFL